MIYNQGTKIIKPLKLTGNVKPDEKFLPIGKSISMHSYFMELNVTDLQEITASRMENTTGTFEIERPYLNPKSKYKEEEIKVSVFSDVPLDLSVSGGGEDWASKLVYLEEEQKTMIRNVRIGAFVLGSTMIIIGIYMSITTPVSLLDKPVPNGAFLIMGVGIGLLVNVFSGFLKVDRTERLSRLD